jgi:hypothetical protein
MQQLKDKYRNIDVDLKKVNDYQDIEYEYNNMCSSLESSKKYIVYQSNQVLELMKNKQFVCQNEEGHCELTYTGKVASYLKEIQPLISSGIMSQFNFFENYETTDIIKIMSIFCDIKVEDSIKNNYPITNGKCEDVMKVFITEYDNYSILEDQYQVFTGINTNTLNFDIYEYIEKWCKATNEVECRVILKDIKEEKDVSLGDFCKALLKISTICKELYTMAIEMQHIEFAHKLSKVDEHILKFVVTNQSLYV